jgi:hypothetical protein
MWGEQHFVGDDAPAVLKARIDADMAAIAAQGWLGLGIACRQRRWAVRAAAPTAREAFRSLFEIDGYSRSPTAPYLLAHVLSKPERFGEARRDRGSVHATHPDVRRGQRLGLVLEDWFHVPPSAPGQWELLFPLFVTVPAEAGRPDAWVVEVGNFFLFEDGLTLRPARLDILPRDVRGSGPLEKLEGDREIGG